MSRGARRLGAAAGKAPDLMTLYLGAFEITYEPLETPAMEALPSNVKNRLDELCEMVRSDPARALVEVEPLSARFPEVLSLANWRITCMARLGREKEARELAEKLAVENPDYFFGRLTLAELCLHDLDLDRAGRVLGKIKHPCVVCPDRTVFHISEILGYFHLCTMYYILRGEFEIAENFLELLQSIDAEAPSTRELTEYFKACRSGFTSLLSAMDEIVKETGALQPAARRSKRGVASVG